MALNCRKVIIPFMIENCRLEDDFNFYLNNVQRYEAYLSKASAMEMMIKQIRAIIGISDDDPVTVEKAAPSTEAPPAAATVPTLPADELQKRYLIALREEARGNMAVALRMNQELAEMGFPPSINYVGINYILGDLLEQNIPLGVEYYRRSAELGYAPAQMNLGDCYMNGMGVEVDRAEAVRWYLAAANNPEEPDGDAMFRLFLAYKFG